MVSFSVSQFFPVDAETLFQAWLDSEQHSKMTGGIATCTDAEGDSFSAWDGYISGVNVVIEPNKRIVQKWRTTEFADDEEDSLIEILFQEQSGKCELTLVHTNIPEGQSDYKKGWIEH